MNVAIDENLSIAEMAQIALKACDAEHIKIEYDITKPNGQYRKDVSIDLLKSKIPSFSPINLYDGIKKTYNYLIENNTI
jgi:nucleoside-diphosphate-sugar epimerase